MGEIIIDPSAIKEIADKGIRRTIVFLGLGLNAANLEDFQDYELSKLPQEVANLPIQLIPSNASPETIAMYKKEFALWIIGCGLRELIESHMLFLDELHSDCLLIEKVNGANKFGDPQRLQKEFHRSGINTKLSLLQERFHVGSKYPDFIESINKARNCITHRRGMVSHSVDCGGDGVMHVKWVGIDVFFELELSKKILILSEVIGKTLSEPATVNMRRTERDKVYRPETFLSLSHFELAEICFFLHLCHQDLMQSFMQYMRQMGVAFKEG